jgi:hypothetical protein
MWNPEYFVEFYVGRNVTKSVNCLGQIKIVNNFSQKVKFTFGTNSIGYLITGISNKADYRIHRLVATYFCPNGNKEQNQVDHIDGVKDNNCWLNLRWST